MAPLTPHPPDPQANHDMLTRRPGFLGAGLGAPADGPALELFLEPMPADLGMAFVERKHLPPPPPKHCRRHFEARQRNAGVAGKKARAGADQPRLPLPAAQAPGPCALPDIGVAA